jgi:hypothetical protein
MTYRSDSIFPANRPELIRLLAEIRASRAVGDSWPAYVDDVAAELRALDDAGCVVVPKEAPMSDDLVGIAQRAVGVALNDGCENLNEPICGPDVPDSRCLCRTLAKAVLAAVAPTLRAQGAAGGGRE